MIGVSGTPAGLRRSLVQAVRSLPGLRALVDHVRRDAPVLPEDEVSQFNGTGFLVIDPGIPEQVLDRAVADMSRRPEYTRDVYHGCRVFQGWDTSRAVRDIAFAPRVLRILRQLYHRTPRAFQTLNFPTGTEQSVHSDWIHFASDPPGYMCGVWVALEDIDLENGPLVYYPESHKLPLVTMDDVAPGPGKEHYHLYEARIKQLIEQHDLQPSRALLKKGQALIWAANLLHGGGTHLDKSRTRHSQVTHYFFEGCQYYMPLASYGGYRHLKDEWVR